MSAGRQPKVGKRKVTRILLVDDHPMIRERLAEIIHREPDMLVCAEAEDRHSAIAAAATGKPDLAIIDLTLKNSHGLDLIKDLAAQFPRIVVLVLSMHDESLHAERVMRAGAKGYITKQEATRGIMLAIRTVLDGGIYLSEKIALRVASLAATGSSAGTPFALDKLTDREMQVFELIGQGFSTRQIAGTLHLGIPTVDTYRGRIKDKLQLRDASELLQHAILWNQANHAPQ
jgi:DNA-binding NarL/FixJ family response regulator